MSRRWTGPRPSARCSSRLGPKAQQRLRPRSVIYVHLAEEALDSLGVTPGCGRPGSEVARVRGLGPVGLQQLKDWLGEDRIEIRPVIDPAGQVPVDRYEIPARDGRGPPAPRALRGLPVGLDREPRGRPRPHGDVPSDVRGRSTGSDRAPQPGAAGTPTSSGQDLRTVPLPPTLPRAVPVAEPVRPLVPGRPLGQSCPGPGDSGAAARCRGRTTAHTGPTSWRCSWPDDLARHCPTAGPTGRSRTFPRTRMVTPWSLASWTTC